MSRSYKKFPQFTDNLWRGRSSGVNGKTYNSRKIRRALKKDMETVIPKGTYFRKYGLDSYDLWEYKSYQTKQDAIKEWEKDQVERANGVNWWDKYHPTKEQAILDWFLSYKRK